MNNLLSPFCRDVLRGGRAFVSHHAADFGAEHSLVELERLFTVAIEIKVGIHLHSTLLVDKGIALRLQFTTYYLRIASDIVIVKLCRSRLDLNAGPGAR